MAEDQLERFTELHTTPEPAGSDPEGRVMPFETALDLNADGERRLIDHAFRRMDELRDQMGHGQVSGDTWWGDLQGIDVNDPLNANNPARTWMGKRRCYDMTYANDLRFRAVLLGGIFSESNLVVPLARRIARQMIARGTNYFFSTDPWFAVYPVGDADQEKAEKADKYMKWKMDQSKLKQSLERGIERAFTLGEAVQKTTWVTRDQVYRTYLEVLVDADGKDILSADGDFIVENDLWVLREVEDPTTGEMIQDDVLVLKRDGQTPRPAEMTFIRKLVTRRTKIYNGPEAVVLHYLDFLCPLDAPSVQEADCVVHVYDMPVMTLADQWKKALPEGATAEEAREETRKAIEMIRRISSTGNEMKSGQNTVVPNMDNSNANQYQQSQPIANIAEFHLRYDADGDGMMEEIMLVVDTNTRTPIFYDYEANVTPDGLRPFSVIKVGDVPGRWYGIGAMEMFETSQNAVDLFVNRWSFSQSSSGRVTFWNPEATLEGKANPNLQLNWGETYRLAPNKTEADAVKVVYLENNTGPQVQQLSEYFTQISMNESGVQNANDARSAGLDTAKLATGIRNIEKSGQELFSLYIGHLEPGISETLSKMVKLVWANLEHLEVYRYFEEGEGGVGAGEMLSVDPAEINNIELDTRVLLSRTRGEQVLESSTTAIETVNAFYAQPYPVQVATAAMFRDILKNLQIANADTIIQPVEVLQPVPGASLPNPKQVSQSVAPDSRQSPPNL